MSKNRIEELRKKRGMGQKELAEKIETSQQAISLYERGDREPKLETWQKLAKFFDVSVPYLQGIDIDEYIDKVEINKLSNLGLFFYEEESHSNNESIQSRELNFHEEMTNNILYSQKDSALKSIDDYMGFLSKLRSKINTFDADKFMNHYLELIADYYWNDSREKIAAINNKLIREVLDRAEKGNKGLRDQIVKGYIFDSSDIFESYLEYQKNHGENTAEVEHYIKESEKEFKQKYPKSYKLVQELDQIVDNFKIIKKDK